MSRYPYDPPIDAGLSCRNCGDPILAVAAVFSGSLSINGLREFEWAHAHGTAMCRPKTVAQPFDGWQATSKVKAIEDARAAAEDALIAATEHLLPVGARVLANLPHPYCLSDCYVLGYDTSDGGARYKLSRRVGSPMSGYAYRPLAQPVAADLVKPYETSAR